MYIVAIAWLYVTLMMAVTEKSVTAGILTFTFYGLLPCALLVWLIGTPARRRAKFLASARESALSSSAEPEQEPGPGASANHPVDTPDGADTKRD
jgi:hypothetical protein